MLTFSLEQFSWNKSNNSLTAEASVLGFEPGKTPNFVTIRSNYTGTEMTFFYDNEDMAKNEWYDGEMWTYRCIDPHCKIQRVVILND